ncbi:MAG: pyridoxamine 5'-phosphate oxidase family protein [Candidatus Adiutrix sp.]|jgi:nitroimidazol reductase NimA-like FMN-containing flavoprotein (pyridoxamine 5'-phosphate oxidase superfamily)|nr:pyridoxamine 5'-phosphate oxidase family protein [Candidatus Adiutrix sp.]
MHKDYVWTDQVAIDEFLSEQEVGYLSTLDAEGWPYTVPVNFLWLGGSIFFHSGRGLKIENLRQNPKVCLNVGQPLSLLTADFTSFPCRDTQLGLSVLVRGLARELKNPEDKLNILNKIIAKYDPGALADTRSSHLPPESLMEQPAVQGCLVVEIEVTSLSGRRSLLTGKPEKYRRAAVAHLQKAGREKGCQLSLKTAAMISRHLDDD